MSGIRVRGHTASAVLEFGAQPSTSLPPFIASFAHPIHVDPPLSEIGSGAIVEGVSDWHETDRCDDAVGVLRAKAVRVAL